MSDIFISYARSTATQALAAAAALRGLGYSVWLDDQLPAHRAYTHVIEEQLASAKAALVIWSADAVRSEWVLSEANRAREDRKLVQLAVDATRLPMPFDQIDCADLSTWSGEPDAPEWRLVLSSIAELTGAARGGNERAPELPLLDAPAIGTRSKPGEGPALALPSKLSIVILPAKNLSGDPEQEYLADALTEDIVAALSRWRWFFVISSHTSFRYKNRDVDVVRIGNELGVRYALECSVRTIGGRLRLTVQLIDAISGSNIWADQFNRDLTDILALQDELTEQIVAAIEPAMLRTEGVGVARKSLNDFSALDCFYRGMWNLNKMSEASDREAEALFRDAIRRDPELSLGYIGLARALFGRAVFASSPKPIPMLRRSRAAAQKAINLDPHDACGYYASSGASLYLGDHGAALGDARSAINLNPNFAFAQVRLGQVLVFSGRAAEGIAPIERGVRLSPYDPQLGVTLDLLALAHYQAGNYSEAVVHATSAMHQSDARGSIVLAASLAQLGKLEEARDVLPQTKWDRASTQRPMVAPYADQRLLEHLRKGVRLARGRSSPGRDPSMSAGHGHPDSGSLGGT